MVSGAKEDAEKVFCPDFCVLRGSDSGAGGGGGGVFFAGEGDGGILHFILSEMFEIWKRKL